MIRLTGGEWNGRKIKTPRGMQSRPSASRVREAFFDVLGNDIKDVDFFDFFAGSGAVGFEALSRGARYCTFVESVRSAVLCLRENIILLGCREQATVFPGHLPGWVRSGAFVPRMPAVVFIDPPYAGALAEKTMTALGELPIAWLECSCGVQTSRQKELPEKFGPWKLRKRYPHGDSALWMYDIATDLQGSGV